MRKIVSLFQRNYDTDRLVRDEVVPGAEWVLAGAGVATRKYDGVCTMVREGRLFKRYELKPGKTAPPQWEAADEVDTQTGKQMGWIPVGEGPEDKGLRDAWERTFTGDLQRVHVGDIVASAIPDGTYEFLGPKSQGNVEQFPVPTLLAHAEADRLLEAPRSFDAIRAYLDGRNIEGIVWHHPDGRMVKIKAKDFGIKRHGG